MSRSLQQQLLETGRLLSEGLLNILVPHICMICCESLIGTKAGMCEACWRAITTDQENACPSCATTIGPHTLTTDGCPWCRREKYHFQAAMRLGIYDNELKRAILLLKNPRNALLATEIARLWVERDRDRFEKYRLDGILPIPSHWIRWLWRGMNPMDAVAKELGRLLGVPFLPRGLQRVRNTPRQMNWNVNRRTNVIDAFTVPNGKRYDGQNLLLLDDVFTTGATANEASRPLLKAGAACVVVAMLARTPVKT